MASNELIRFNKPDLLKLCHVSYLRTGNKTDGKRDENIIF